MIKRFAVCLGFILFMLFVLLTLVSNAQVPDKTFILTINSKDVIVKLPDALPDMETAILAGEECFNLTVCRQQYCLDARMPGHDHVDFVFTDAGEVIALVWLRTLESNIFWKYVAGIPVLSSIEEIIELVSGSQKLKEVSGGLPI